MIGACENKMNNKRILNSFLTHEKKRFLHLEAKRTLNIISLASSWRLKYVHL